MSKIKSKDRIKRSSKEDQEQEEEADAASSGDGRVLCCVPPSLVGCPQKVISEPGTAVRMGCTNLRCTSPRLLHRKCFDRMEKHLVTVVLRFKPVSKKWSEANGGKRIRANVWNCRGNDLLQRMCPCSCGGSLRKEEAGIPFPKSVVRKKLKPTACDASLTKTDQRLSKFPYLSLKTDLSRLMKLYSKSVSQPVAEGRLEEEEDASKQLFVSGIPRGCSKLDLLGCFEDFGKVVNVWISSHLCYFAFVTFDSPESVDEALSREPILLFGRHRLNVQRKTPQFKSRVEAKEITRYKSPDQISSSSSSPPRGSQPTSPDTEDPTLVDQGAMRSDLGARDGCEQQETDNGSSREEIYWSDDDEEEERGQLEDNSWSQEELLSNLMTLLQAQEQLEQERKEWIPEKKENETDQLRLDADHKAQRMKLEAENQVLRDSLEMTKEQLRVQDARVKNEDAGRDTTNYGRESIK